MDFGNALNRYETLVPCEDLQTRQNTFIFSFPDGKPLTASVYLEFLYEMLWRASQYTKECLTMEQIKQEYSGHSTRIGGINAMKEAVLPDGSKFTFELEMLTSNLKFQIRT